METNLDKLNKNWDKRMEAIAAPAPESDAKLLVDYRNSIVYRAALPPRLDDINARFLIDELQTRIAEAINEFDAKRKAL